MTPSSSLFKTWDVVIVGAGPAGSSAAHDLARLGVRVLVLEKHSLPRYKTCGGGIVGRALRLLSTDVQPVVEHRCHRAELHLEQIKRRFLTQRPHPIVTMTMRSAFDLRLLEAARAAGAVIRDRCEVRDLIPGTSTLTLCTSRGSIRGYFVLAADGALSRVARVAGWGAPAQLLPALECEVPVSQAQWQRFANTARFDLDCRPAGYAWVFPKRHHLSIGVLRAPWESANLNRRLHRYLQRIGLGPEVRAERHGFVIPVSPRPGPFVSGRILLAGDAAGLADPVTGEGITFAVRSGQLAAQALLGGHLNPARVARLYRRSLAREILPELRLGRLLASVTYRSCGIHTSLFRRLGDRFCEAMTDVLTGEATYRSLLSRPLNYLRFVRLWLGAPAKMSGKSP